MPENKYAVAVLVVAQGGPDQGKIPLIQNPRKPRPIYWKIPGGRSENGETPEQAAVRELEEETGILIPETDLKEIARIPLIGHTRVIFTATVEELRGLKRLGDEGEIVDTFWPHQILAMPDFFPPHREVVTQTLRELTR